MRQHFTETGAPKASLLTVAAGTRFDESVRVVVSHGLQLDDTKESFLLEYSAVVL